MRRDSLFSEKIVWSGEPKAVVPDLLARVAAWTLAITSAVSTFMAIAASKFTHTSTNTLILFAAWCATLALAVRVVPVIWAQAAKFVVTDHHVIWARGSIKRTLHRDAISYARIHWSKKHPGVGDLELVRAVPTGVLQRGLTLILPGVVAPDRVWSIVRGVPTTAAAGDGRLPLAQRLDEGERVVWSGHPVQNWRAWLPISTRRAITTAIGLFCGAASIRTIIHAVPAIKRTIMVGVPVTSIGFAALVLAFVLTAGLLAAACAFLVYRGVVRKPLLDRKTSYLVTDRRVLIQRGTKELHLDRRNVVDIVEEVGMYGGHNVYLLMDGPQSRGLAASGAFGPSEGAKGFLPVLRDIDDIEGLRLAFANQRSSMRPLRARAA